MLSEIVKIEGWRTTDREVHLTKKEAAQHQAGLDFDKWYYEKLERQFDYEPSSTDVQDWLLKNKKVVIEFLSYFEAEPIIENLTELGQQLSDATFKAWEGK